jgi:hypothetical protein
LIKKMNSVSSHRSGDSTSGSLNGKTEAKEQLKNLKSCLSKV